MRRKLPVRLFAIDPGPQESAYVVVDTANGLKPKQFGKELNRDLRARLWVPSDYLVIEQIGHYGTGMPAGKDVFDTCIWIGRFIEAHPGDSVALIKRATVKAHLCGSAKANDGNIIQALVDRFAPNTPNHGKGGKNQPGWFYGFHSDIWQAYSLAVYFADKLAEDPTLPP